MPKNKPTKVLEITALFLVVVLVTMGSILVLKSRKKNNKKPEIIAQSEIHSQNVAASIINTFPETIEEFASEEEENLTDKLSDEMLDKSLGLGLNSGIFPDLSIDSLDNMKKLESLFILPKISDQEIKISISQNEQTYFAEVAKILNNIFSELEKPEIEIAMQAIETKEYQVLDPYIIAYQQSYEQIQDLAVPPALKEIHKTQLAIYLIASQILESIQNSEEDPLKSLVAISKYSEIAKATQGLSKTLYEMVKTNY